MNVANHVGETLEYTDTDDWQNIDGKMNPADICTRGLMDPANLLQQDKHGKSWLVGSLCKKKQALQINTMSRQKRYNENWRKIIKSRHPELSKDDE